MNNLSTLLMDRLGRKMNRDEARERERVGGGEGGGARGRKIENRGRGGIKWHTEKKEEKKKASEGWRGHTLELFDPNKPLSP